jgi:hypothetical protein
MLRSLLCLLAVSALPDQQLKLEFTFRDYIAIVSAHDISAQMAFVQPIQTVTYKPDPKKEGEFIPTGLRPLPKTERVPSTLLFPRNFDAKKFLEFTRGLQVGEKVALTMMDFKSADGTPRYVLLKYQTLEPALAKLSDATTE